MAGDDYGDNLRARRAQVVGEKLRRELGSVVSAALADPQVVEIMLNPDGRLWIERLGERMQPAGQMGPAQAESLMATVAATLRTTITRENPILECELPFDGSRFAAAIPPAVPAPAFSIRRRASQVFTLQDYVRQGVMTLAQCRVLMKYIEDRKNILIVGGTGCGKTTLANAVIQFMVSIAADQRLVIIEDTVEIQCAAPNAVAFRTTDTVDMLRLLRATLRFRPDRIVVGEVRGPEAHALLKAWNTGHPGGCATVHSGSAQGGLVRLEQLILEATNAPSEVLIGEAVDLIVVLVRTPTGRRVEEVVAVERYAKNEGRYVLRSET